MKTLVVFYSRTGHTRNIARVLGALLGADVEEIRDTRERSGLRGYLRAGLEALLKRPTKLHLSARDPRTYDLVVVGTPVWNASVSSPIRTYLSERRVDIRSVAFFCTHGGTGAHRAFRQMGKILGRAPVGTLAVTESEILRGAHEARLEAFAETLGKEMPRVVPIRTRQEARPSDDGPPTLDRGLW